MKAVSEGGIGREELREAVQTYYGMIGWDPATVNPLPATQQELDVAWAVEQLLG